METTREETAINIAVINKVSKQVATACKLKSNDLLDEALSSGADIPALASSIIAYIKEDRDPILYKQLMHLANTDPIRKYIRTKSGYRKANEVKDIADAVDQLDKFGNDLYYREGNGEYENLLPFFSNEEAQGLLQRAVDAGLLKDDYQPRESTARFQLKLIAICMMEIMEYQHGSKWCYFEQLWKKDVARRSIPLTKGMAINRVAVLYPEVNLWGLILPKHNQLALKTDLTEEQARKLFKGLVHYGYLGSRTPVENFLSIMGIGEYPFHTVNWIGTGMNSLVYCVKRICGHKNSDLLKRMCDCFTVNGQPLNHGTLKTKSSYVDRNVDKFDFVPLLDKIIASVKKK